MIPQLSSYNQCGAVHLPLSAFGDIFLVKEEHLKSDATCQSAKLIELNTITNRVDLFELNW